MYRCLILIYLQIMKPCFVELSGISLDNCGFFSAKSFFDIGEEEFAKRYRGMRIFLFLLVHKFISHYLNSSLSFFLRYPIHVVQ